MCTLGSIHSLAYHHKHDRSLNDDIERTHQPYPKSVTNQTITVIIFLLETARTNE